jgi:hypothetical protein
MYNCAHITEIFATLPAAPIQNFIALLVGEINKKVFVE